MVHALSMKVFVFCRSVPFNKLDRKLSCLKCDMFQIKHFNIYIKYTGLSCKYFKSLMELEIQELEYQKKIRLYVELSVFPHIVLFNLTLMAYL